MAPNRNNNKWTSRNEPKKQKHKKKKNLCSDFCRLFSNQNRNINIIYRNWQNKYFTFSIRWYCLHCFDGFTLRTSALCDNTIFHSYKPMENWFGPRFDKKDHMSCNGLYHVTYAIAHTLIANDLIHFYDVRNKMQCNNLDISS